MCIIKEIKAEQTWPMRQKIMYPELTMEAVILPQDQNGMHYGLFIKEELIGVVSFFVNRNELQFRKLAILEKEQGKGYGSRLLHDVFTFAKQNKIKKIWCNARVHKSKFYEYFGMYKTEKTFQKQGIDFVVMEVIL